MTERLIKEIERAEHFIQQFAPYYHALEADCPSSFKALMLVNDWHSPFIAINELLKRIDTNEMLIKRESKKTGVKFQYKRKYKELRELVQKQSIGGKNEM